MSSCLRAVCLAAGVALASPALAHNPLHGIAFIGGRIGLAIVRPPSGGAIKVTIKGMNNPTILYGFVEYNTLTCGEISPGTWTNSKNTKYGTAASSTATGMLGNGACPGVTFTFGVLVYDWTKKGTQDSVASTWATPDGDYSLPERFSLTLKK